MTQGGAIYGARHMAQALTVSGSPEQLCAGAQHLRLVRWLQPHQHGPPRVEETCALAQYSADVVLVRASQPLQTQVCRCRSAVDLRTCNVSLLDAQHGERIRSVGC